MIERDGYGVGEDETLDDLILGNYRLLQSRAGYRFSIDAVLLAHFVELANITGPVYDLGTGNGVIPILLAARDSRIKIVGIELQESMFMRAARNISFNNLDERISIIRGDVRRLADVLPPNSSRLVVCNPPFWSIGQGKISRHPEKALARHELEGRLIDFVEGAAYLLQPGGRACFIHRVERSQEINDLLRLKELYPSRQRMVQSFAGRAPQLLLIEGTKGYQGERMDLAPLYIYQQPGVYSQEVSSWYSCNSTEGK